MNIYTVIMFEQFDWFCAKTYSVLTALDHHMNHNYYQEHHVTSRHVTSRHVTSRHVTSRHVTSHHVTSRHVTSHHITSHHITSACLSRIILRLTPTRTPILRHGQLITKHEHRNEHLAWTILNQHEHCMNATDRRSFSTNMNTA